MKKDKFLPEFVYPSTDKSKHPLADYKPSYVEIEGKMYERGSLEAIKAASLAYGHPLSSEEKENK